MGLTSFRVWCAVCYGVLCVFNCVKKIRKEIMLFCVPSTPLVRHTQGAGCRHPGTVCRESFTANRGDDWSPRPQQQRTQRTRSRNASTRHRSAMRDSAKRDLLRDRSSGVGDRRTRGMGPRDGTPASPPAGARCPALVSFCRVASPVFVAGCHSCHWPRTDRCISFPTLRLNVDR